MGFSPHAISKTLCMLFCITSKYYPGSKSSYQVRYDSLIMTPWDAPLCYIRHVQMLHCLASHGVDFLHVIVSILAFTIGGAMRITADW